jgi:hypothetical protein
MGLTPEGGSAIQGTYLTPPRGAKKVLGYMLIYKGRFANRPYGVATIKPEFPL